MDNNPFRSQNANMYTGMPSGQGQFPQSNPMPSTSNFGNSNLLVDTSLPGSTQQHQPLQQQQQPYYSPQQQQHPQQSFYQPMNNQQFGYSQAPQQQPTSTTTTTFPFMQQQQQQPSFQQPQQTSSFYNPTQSFGYGGSFNNGVTSFPQYQQQQQPQAYDPSNVFIPQNFGVSSTGNNNNPGAQQFHQQQSMPQRPTVDASAYLKKSGKVRKEECPICHKMIEGDDPAINHHVNEHLEYDM
ncbi:hypothetical protein O0I10_007904 [Lichtheimia ornata]|uniref:Uncharacterized protein n=1 Tax=Lichtheimia ornata TaxID=688661 RepID=A0AAD7V0A0_9FUNG|nr:uncharacterized protein O0I10_007904 [Lichtheimia ornata]KAJ8656339.1 hypothetical protein O0I10_007904 [Lichtheimia ornata]